jgi:hypothetical protein
MKCLRALDAETGQPITRFQVWKRCHGVWDGGKSYEGEAILLGADAWVVLAGKYRGVRGTDVPDEDGIIEVALEPGSWSALLVFEEAAGDTPGDPDFGRNRRLLAGVEVFADGRSVGKSDDEGMLLLSSDSSPRKLAFRLEGWHVVEESDPGAVPRPGSVHHVWMLSDG